MEPGKILLNVAQSQGGPGPSQVIAQNVGNRLYRITNNGTGNGGRGTMRIQVARTVLMGITTTSFFELVSGRSMDVFGSTITLLTLDALQLVGTYDTI
jgi:hypothetical protein